MAQPSVAQLRAAAREERISSAVWFLLHRAVALSSDAQKMEFLLSKGMSKQEVADAMSRAKTIVMQYWQPWQLRKQEPTPSIWKRLSNAVTRLSAWQRRCLWLLASCSAMSLAAWLCRIYWRRRLQQAAALEAEQKLQDAAVPTQLARLERLVEDAKRQDHAAYEAASSLRSQVERSRRAMDQSVADYRRGVQDSEAASRAAASADVGRDFELSENSVRTLQEMLHPGAAESSTQQNADIDALDADAVGDEAAQDASPSILERQAERALKLLQQGCGSADEARTTMRTIGAILKRAIADGTEMRREAPRINTKSERYVAAFGASGSDSGVRRLLELAGYERSKRDKDVLTLPALKGVADAQRVMVTLRRELKECARKSKTANGIPKVVVQADSAADGECRFPVAGKSFEQLRADAEKWLEEETSTESLGKRNGVHTGEPGASSPGSSARASPDQSVSPSPARPAQKMPWLSSVVQKQLKTLAAASSTGDSGDTSRSDRAPAGTKSGNPS